MWPWRRRFHDNTRVTKRTHYFQIEYANLEEDQIRVLDRGRSPIGLIDKKIVSINWSSPKRRVTAFVKIANE
jgi:hypothetical protein